MSADADDTGVVKVHDTTEHAQEFIVELLTENGIDEDSIEVRADD